MNVTKLDCGVLPVDQDLQRRVLAGRLDRTVEFLVMEGVEEAGLLVFDHWPSHGLGIIHEIYVLPKFKGRGFGATLLAYAQVHAMSHGCSTLQLTARRLDPERFSDDQLVEWYSRHGFTLMDAQALTMIKRL